MITQTHKILNIATPNPHLQSLFSQKLGISKILAQLLLNRGVKTIAEAEKFLDTKLEDLFDPYLFADMARAVALVKKCAQKKERVMIFSDYDVDGVTALALLKNTLARMGIRPEHYIPHRIKEGYGLSRNIAKIAKEKKIKLLITADCGTNSLAQLKELKTAGTEVIITDHHESTGTDAAALAWAVLNPKFKKSNYPYRDLAGVGVAYKFCQALTAELLDEDLDLVSLGTIADSVPLTGENRIIAKEGLSRIARTKRLGLRMLLEASRIQDREITPEFVSFILGPRINAAGRLDSAETSLNLLLSQEAEEARNLAKILEMHNRQRQKIESAILEEAQDLINQEVNFKDHKVMVVAKEGWHLGVLGIVASKLAERFYRPAILISLNEGLCRGSGRSIKNFHLFEGLLECRELLDNFGGHQHAIGMVIPQDNITEFKNKINQFANKSLGIEDLIPSLDIDMELNLDDLSPEFISERWRWPPSRYCRARRSFYTRNLRLKGQPRIFSKDTLKCWVSDGNLTYSAIGFGMATLLESILAAESFDLVYTPGIDSWEGKESLILEIKEIFLR